MGDGFRGDVCDDVDAMTMVWIHILGLCETPQLSDIDF